MENKILSCPFCNEKNLDKIDLKFHLQNYCQEYQNIPGTTLVIYKKRYEKLNKKRRY